MRRLLVLAVLLAALSAASCGGSLPGSPEELYAEIARLNGAGDTEGTWYLLTDDARRDFEQAIDGYRKVIRGNPDDKTDKFFEQFRCSRQEVLTLPYLELWKRENQGRERVFIGAKIVDKQPDPRKPDEVILTVEPPAGPKVLIRVRHVAKGWALCAMMPKVN
jgi:hypothetical protein